MSSSPTESRDKGKGRAIPNLSIEGARPSKRGHEAVDPSAEASVPFASGSREEPPSPKKFKKMTLSCAECRRLKLKCDRIFPCQSCRKRGCDDICPNGVLVSGKGTRFILATTEQLHSKISQMADRIRQLEEALEGSHGTSHHLLRPDLLLIRSSLELYNDAQTGHSLASPCFGNPGTTDDTSRAEAGVEDHEPSDEGNARTQSPQSPYATLQLSLPSSVVQSSRSLPLSPTIFPFLRQVILDNLPSQHHALYLWEQTRHNALWQLNPHSDEGFVLNVINYVYGVSGVSRDNLSPRRLALLLMIVAVGTHVDLQRSPDSASAERYYHLSRAALSEESLMEDASVETIMTLFYLSWYLLVFSGRRNAAALAWSFSGLTSKLAQSIGLHRDGVGSKVIPEEEDKRRTIFWETLYLDGRLSLSLGRPPALLSLTHTYSKRPSYSFGSEPSRNSNYFHEWKHTSYIHCISPALSLLSSFNPDYAAVIELDKSIRRFFEQSRTYLSGVSPSRSLTMQEATMHLSVHSLLVHIHRTFFTRALSDPGGLHLSNQYAPSVVAIFRSACDTIMTVEVLHKQEPALAGRFSCIWSNAFAAAVSLCLIVLRAPFCIMAPPALQGLEDVRSLFQAAKGVSPKALEVLPSLESMVHKSWDTFNLWSSENSRSLPSSDAGFSSTSSNSSLDAFEGAHPCLMQTVDDLREKARALQAPTHGRQDLGPAVEPLPEAHPASSPEGSRSDLSPTSTGAAPNLDFGALDSSWNDQSWMTWF